MLLNFLTNSPKKTPKNSTTSLLEKPEGFGDTGGVRVKDTGRAAAQREGSGCHRVTTQSHLPAPGGEDRTQNATSRSPERLEKAWESRRTSKSDRIDISPSASSSFPSQRRMLEMGLKQVTHRDTLNITKLLPGAQHQSFNPNYSFLSSSLTSQ